MVPGQPPINPPPVGAIPPYPRTRSGGRLGRRRLLAALAALLLAGWIAALALSLKNAADEARAGTAGLASLRGSAGPFDFLSDRGERLRSLRQAQASFESAHASVASPVFAPLRLLPVLGRQVRSVQALTSGAASSLDVGADSIAAAREEMEADVGSPAGRVEMLGALAGISSRADARLRAIDLGPDRALMEPLATAYEQLSTELLRIKDSASRARDVTEGMHGFLEGPRTYLLLAANNAEMRAGSGMFLEAGLLTIDKGEIHLGELIPTWDPRLDQPDPPLPLERDLAARWGWLVPNQQWLNLGVSPRFDVTAELASKMWVAAGQPPVDGVIAADVNVLKAILAAAGEVQAGGKTITANNVVRQILHDQYVETEPTSQAHQFRRGRLAEVASATMEALNRGDWEPVRLAANMIPVGRGRHLLAWSPDRREQAMWEGAGVDGKLQPDSMLLSVLNRGGNKLDQFLSVDAEIEVQRGRKGTDVTVRVDLSNAVPEGEPGYIAGPGPDTGVGEGVYVGLLSVNLPAAAQGARFSGIDELAVAGADGPTRVVATWIQIARNEKKSYELRFGLPAGHRFIQIEPSARIPGVTISFGSESGVNDRSTRIGW